MRDTKLKILTSLIKKTFFFCKNYKYLVYMYFENRLAEWSLALNLGYSNFDGAGSDLVFNIFYYFVVHKCGII